MAPRTTLECPLKGPSVDSVVPTDIQTDCFFFFIQTDYFFFFIQIDYFFFALEPRIE
jgi:hypothetical protein